MTYDPHVDRRIFWGCVLCALGLYWLGSFVGSLVVS